MHRIRVRRWQRLLEMLPGACSNLKSVDRLILTCGRDKMGIDVARGAVRMHAGNLTMGVQECYHLPGTGVTIDAVSDHSHGR